MNTIRPIVRGAYDVQKMRIETGNRLVAQFKQKLGQQPGESEDTLDADAKVLLKDLREAFEKITDGVTTLTRAKIPEDGLVSSFTELVLLDRYFELEAAESKHFRNLKHALKEHPIYNEFLEGVRGIGPAMAGVIVSEINIREAEYPSSIWRYAGLDVAPDGRGRSRRKEHLEEKEYIDADGNPATRVGITFNPFLKTKLVGVLGSSFLKQPADKCIYRKVYDDYKHRLQNMPAHAEKTKGHIHNMAVRYMIKRFLVDLYRTWRALEGLPVAEEYSVAKLNITHKVA